jgi:hypothetical protein
VETLENHLEEQCFYETQSNADFLHAALGDLAGGSDCHTDSADIATQSNPASPDARPRHPNSGNGTSGAWNGSHSRYPNSGNHTKHPPDSGNNAHNSDSRKRTGHYSRNRAWRHYASTRNNESPEQHTTNPAREHNPDPSADAIGLCESVGGIWG